MLSTPAAAMTKIPRCSLLLVRCFVLVEVRRVCIGTSSVLIEVHILLLRRSILVKVRRILIESLWRLLAAVVLGHVLRILRWVLPHILRVRRVVVKTFTRCTHY